MRGPIYFVVFLPNLTVSNFGSSKIFLIFLILVTCKNEAIESLSFTFTCEHETAVTTTWPFSPPLVTLTFRSLPFLPWQELFSCSFETLGKKVFLLTIVYISAHRRLMSAAENGQRDTTIKFGCKLDEPFLLIIQHCNKRYSCPPWVQWS